jgi:hypothetical protein
MAASVHVGQLDAARHWDERLALVEACAGWPRVSSATLGSMLRYSAKALRTQGERARAEDLWRQLRELADRTHVATIRMYAASGDLELAIVDGRLEDAWARFNLMADQTDELGMSVRVRRGGSSDLALSLYRGRASRWLGAFDHNVGRATVTQPDRHSPTSIRLTAGRALCLAQIGRLEEAQTLIAPLLDNVEACVRANRSDAAAWLIRVGLDSKVAVVEAVREKVTEIRRIRGDAKALAEEADMPRASEEPEVGTTS